MHKTPLVDACQTAPQIKLIMPITRPTDVLKNALTHPLNSLHMAIIVHNNAHFNAPPSHQPTPTTWPASVSQSATMSQRAGMLTIPLVCVCRNVLTCHMVISPLDIVSGIAHKGGTLILWVTCVCGSARRLIMQTRRQRNVLKYVQCHNCCSGNHLQGHARRSARRRHMRISAARHVSRNARQWTKQPSHMIHSVWTKQEHA